MHALIKKLEFKQAATFWFYHLLTEKNLLFALDSLSVFSLENLASADNPPDYLDKNFGGVFISVNTYVVFFTVKHPYFCSNCISPQ
jgi:hypothetical protein